LQRPRRETARVGALHHPVHRTVVAVARRDDAARYEREVGIAERAAEYALPFRFDGAIDRYVCVSHAEAIVAPLDTRIAGAQIAIPSKYDG
jgi:hypothetical protein